jgi:hypothetical protein
MTFELVVGIPIGLPIGYSSDLCARDPYEIIVMVAILQLGRLGELRSVIAGMLSLLDTGNVPRTPGQRRASCSDNGNGLNKRPRWNGGRPIWRGALNGLPPTFCD